MLVDGFDVWTKSERKKWSPDGEAKGTIWLNKAVNHDRGINKTCLLTNINISTTQTIKSLPNHNTEC